MKMTRLKNREKAQQVLGTREMNSGATNYATDKPILLFKGDLLLYELKDKDLVFVRTLSILYIQIHHH